MSDLRSTEQIDERRDELKRVMGPGLLLLFIVGDILGTGIYALTGTVAKEVGGAVWLPFLLAFVVAVMTAFAYLELVTKYPHAGGAAVYTNRLSRMASSPSWWRSPSPHPASHRRPRRPGRSPRTS
jgi:APA family basic amino acid/polyamine antiporter